MTTNKTPSPKKSFWQTIIEPHPSIEDFAERRFASVLATLLLALLPLYFLPEGIRAIIEKHSLSEIAYFGVGILVLGAAYLFTRSPYPRGGSHLTLGYFSLLPFAAILVQTDRYAGENAKKALIWSVPIMLMALILLRPRKIKFVVLFQIGIYLIVPALWDKLSYAQVFSTLWIIIAVGGLMVISAFVQTHYLYKVEEEAMRSKVNEVRFREIFLSSPIALWEADFSKIKTRLDILTTEHGENTQKYILENPSLMKGAASSVILLDANQAALELYGTHDIALLKEKLHVVAGKKGMLALRDGVIALHLGEQRKPIETTHQTLDKAEINVVIRFSLRSGYEDTWERINISISDVTERKAAEANVRQLASAVEASASSVVITNLEGNIQYVNPAFSKITGYTKEESLGENPRVLKSGQHPAKFYKEMWDTLSNGDIWQGEIINKKKNVELYWEHATISPVQNDEGKIVSYVAIKDDITKAKEIEKVLAEERNLLRTLIDSMPDLIFTKDMHGKFSLTNKALAQLAGHSSSADMIGKDEFDVLPSEIAAQFRGIEKEILRTGIPSINHKEKTIDAQGNEIWLSTTKVALKNNDGEIIGIVGIGRDITEEREKNKKLRNLSNATEQSDSAITIADLNGIIEYINPAFTRITGYTEKEIIGKTAIILRSDKHDESFYAKHQKIITSGETWRGEMINKRKDGTFYWEAQIVSPVRDNSGKITHYVSIRNDVTAHRETEEKLRQLSSATKQAASGIVITNLKGVIEFANPAAAKITGYTLKELLGKTPNLLKSGKHDDKFYADIWKTLEKGRIWRGELINKRKDGTFYWELQTISPVRNAKNDITHYVAVKEDISKAKEAEKRIRTLSRAIEQTANGMVIANAEGYIEYVNPAFTQISGYSFEEVVGKRVENIQHSGEHGEEFYTELSNAIAQGKTWKGEIINRRKDGTLYWESLVLSHVSDEDGKITHRVEIKEDITRRKELEQALAIAHEEVLVASDMKTQLLANVSHDMRTPLGSILGYTEMLDAGIFEALNDQQAEATRAIAASTQRLLNFVSDLLNQAQIDTGEIILNESSFSPQLLLEGLGGEVSLARTQGLVIETSVDENLPERIIGDAYWLGQIIHN